MPVGYHNPFNNTKADDTLVSFFEQCCLDTFPLRMFITNSLFCVGHDE